MGIELHQIKRGKRKEGIYHIQHINAFHSNMKDWMYKFRGAATKHLANYIYWFKRLQYFNTDKDIVKSKQLFVRASMAPSDTKLRNFKIMCPVYS